MHKFATPAPVSAVLDIPAGRIRFIAADRTDTVVEVRPADATKSRFKRQHPRRFCDVGLFRLVRCPNYLGEVITWTGAFVSGITIYSGPLQWVVSLAGYVCIVYIMFGGARRLEIRQNKNYGADPEYQAYVKSVPILIPFIPLYSVEKYKWLVS